MNYPKQSILLNFMMMSQGTNLEFSFGEMPDSLNLKRSFTDFALAAKSWAER